MIAASISNGALRRILLLRSNHTRKIRHKVPFKIEAS
jgi:hypothetical protein